MLLFFEKISVISHIIGHIALLYVYGQNSQCSAGVVVDTVGFDVATATRP